MRISLAKIDTFFIATFIGLLLFCIFSVKGTYSVNAFQEGVGRNDDTASSVLLEPLDTKMGILNDTGNDLTCNPKIETGIHPALSFQCFLFDMEDIEIHRIETEGIICFRGCNILAQTDPNLSAPPMWGEFPYGIWQCRFEMKEAIEDITDAILFLEIKVPRLPDKNLYDAQYFIQRRDILRAKIEWVEIAFTIVWEASPKQLEELANMYNYFINISGDVISLNIRIRDFISEEHLDDGLGIHFIDPNHQAGEVDIDPNPRYIEHIGGLMWPIPGKGRCFVGSTAR